MKDVSCVSRETFLRAFNGELDDESRARMLDHIAQCQDCREVFHGLKTLWVQSRNSTFHDESIDELDPASVREIAARQIRKLGKKRRPWFLAKTAAVWAVLVWDRLVLARSLGGANGGKGSQTNFTASSDSIGVSLSAAELIDICLAENDRRMAGYDARLLRPTTVPFVIRLARRFMRPRPGAR